MKIVGRAAPADFVREGALFPVTFSVGTASPLLAAPPEPIDGHAIIDTGAENSMVMRHVVVGLGLRPIGVRTVVGVDMVDQRRDIFRIGLRFWASDVKADGFNGAFEFNMTAIPDRFDAPFVAMLGRDFLSEFRYVHDGPAGTFELEWLRAPKARGR